MMGIFDSFFDKNMTNKDISRTEYLKCGLNKNILKQALETCSNMGVNISSHDVYGKLENIYIPVSKKLHQIDSQSLPVEEKSKRIIETIMLLPHTSIMNGELTVLSGANIHVTMPEPAIIADAFIMMVFLSGGHCTDDFIKVIIQKHLEWARKNEAEIHYAVNALIAASHTIQKASLSGILYAKSGIELVS